jgi:dihydroflavonol-4-reductase
VTTLLHGTVLDAAGVGQLMDGAQVVYHLAATIDLRPRKDPLMWRINVEGTRSVARACRDRGLRMEHCSSHHALELEPLSEPLTEEKPPDVRQKCLYHRSKAVAETRRRERQCGVAERLCRERLISRTLP